MTASVFILPYVMYFVSSSIGSFTKRIEKHDTESSNITANHKKYVLFANV